jgi:hypothetical protein
MPETGCFKNTKQTGSETIFCLYKIDDVVKEMEKAGFKSIEIIEHSKEKNCFYIIGLKK